MSLIVVSITLASIALIVSTVALVQMLNIRKLRKHLLKNQRPETFDEALNTLQNHIQVIQINQRQMQDQLDTTGLVLKTAIQKVGMVKFNSEVSDGGNFSFAVALLNHENTGVILSSLYGRQYNRIYVKKIQAGQSETPLTEEEKQALAKISTQRNIDPIPERD